jgi:leucyl-tRNA synthetase
MKEIQRNWIGKSVGALITFDLTHGSSPEERGDSQKEIYAQDFVFSSDLKTWKSLKGNVRENRKNLTEAEDNVWQEVRNSKLGYKFRRQHTIGKFIVDFVCIEKKLVVEIDGAIHDQQKREDEERTKIIQHAGFRVIRFTNDQVLKNINDALKKIKS